METEWGFECGCDDAEIRGYKDWMISVFEEPGAEATVTLQHNKKHVHLSDEASRFLSLLAARKVFGCSGCGFY